jgi:hypothetical protein
MHVLLIEDNEDDAYLIGERLTERTAVDTSWSGLIGWRAD